MNIVPVYDKIVLTPVESEGKTESGLVIPGGGPQIPQGKVLAVGEGHMLADGTIRPMKVKVGDLVILDGGPALQFDEGGQTIWIAREADVLAIRGD